jgi:dihydroorotate dehydrogenase (fumarate)
MHVDAALRAVQAGFDMIELQFGHGYLMAQFISPAVNDREDEYGGSFENRARFPMEVINAVRQAVDIPLLVRLSGDEMIPSGFHVDDMVAFSTMLQDAGADALELNLFIMPSDETKTAQEIETIYTDIAKKIKSEITIPVALKMSYYFSNLAGMVKKLSETNIDGLVLFNRFFAPDFDIDKFEVIPTNVLSSASDLHLSLRWVSLLSGRTNKDIIASTGVHNGEALIKQLLAGATAVQAVSVFYEKGINQISMMLDELKTWMEKHNFNSIDDFRGKMSQAKSEDPAIFERVQFMKYFSDKTYDID